MDLFSRFIVKFRTIPTNYQKGKKFTATFIVCPRILNVIFILGELSTELRNKRQSSEEYHEDRKVVCYYANWAVYRQGDAKFTPQNINPYLCTHLIYAFGGLGKDDSIVPFDEYQDIEKGEDDAIEECTHQFLYFQGVMADSQRLRPTTKT